MNLMPENLPDDPVLLKQMLVQMLSERQLDKGQIVDLKEQIKCKRPINHTWQKNDVCI